jgi:non-heme chloroperoxidase
VRRFLLFALVLAALGLALPPLYYRFRTVEMPLLPAAGERIAVRDGMSVNALVKGEGPAVVLVHGLPGCAYDWTPLVDALAARGFHVIAYDRIGYGRSDARRDDDYTIAGNARDLLGLLETKDLHDVTLVGWSYGGPVVIEATGRDASRIARLVLIGTAGPPQANPEKPPAIMSVLFSKPVLSWLRAVPPAGLAVQASMSRRAFSDGQLPHWWLSQTAANFAAPHTQRTFQEETGRWSNGDASIDPVAVGQPMLILHGDDDRLAPLAIGRWTKQQARKAELVVVPRGSHMLPVTHADEMADRIAAFARPQG